MRALLVLALFAAPLAACGDKGDGASVDFKGDGGSGNFSIKAPGFSGSLKLPKIRLDAKNVEFNGVHLYPGSTVNSFNIDAGGDDDQADGNGAASDGKVRIGFESPADLATVREWFVTRLNKADFALKVEGNSLIGTDDEKKPFRIDFEPAGSGRTKAVVVAGG